MMKLNISNNLTVTDPTEEFLEWCKEKLEFDNPDYQKKLRMNLWVGNTPKRVKLYSQKGNEVILPYGVRGIEWYFPFVKTEEWELHSKVDFNTVIPLYDYQQKAVIEMLRSGYGILQSPAGSGKTQMGIALAARTRSRTLWLTHTKDLLNQSLHRAEQYIDKKMLGTITEGKVNIGQCMTFATIQTMCNVDLNQLKDTWDCVIVDECHRVSGTPTSVTRFSKVLNALRAKHKYGLSATVHRADGLIKATYALLGGIAYAVPEEAVSSRVMKVTVCPRFTTVPMDYGLCTNTDGTINYCNLINYLTEHEVRNEFIVHDLIASKNHYNLILSDRVNHLKTLYNMLPSDLQSKASVIDGKMVSKKLKAEREQAIEDVRNGSKRYLFATFSLAKEGLDIPRLDRLFLTTPQSDYAVIVQSTGRIARVFEGKKYPIVYDYVDNIRLLQNKYKRRCTHYRKCGYCVIGG